MAQLFARALNWVRPICSLSFPAHVCDKPSVAKVANEVIVEKLANSPSFQRAAVRVHDGVRVPPRGA